VSKRRAVHGPGKTREEMVREARVAYQRRDEELAKRRREVGINGVAGERSVRRGERNWWEISGVDGTVDLGAMSPVAEDISNPAEDIISTEEDSPANKDDLKKTETMHAKSGIDGDDHKLEGPFRTPLSKGHRSDGSST
jgi:G protein-coupled receptor GPR1